jgi:protein-L-isoaspartate(D-aspartate) O-methyltransferase
MSKYASARRTMAAEHIAKRGVTDAHVLAAMRAVPRELFVPKTLRASAYADAALPIEDGQTISQPFIVALMIEAAGVRPGARVLEIGAGSGYASAVMSRIAKRVYAIERSALLAKLARKRLARLGYDNIELREGDGACGWPEAAPFDAIIVSAAGAAIPEALSAQLKPGGRLVMPVTGEGDEQHLTLMQRDEDQSFSRRDLGLVRFVPLVAG